MLLNQITTYRNLITLRDGVNVLLRPMTPEDEPQILDMFTAASEEDVRYLRDDVKDPLVIKEWCDELDYNRVLPLVAVVKDQLVGLATIHFRTGRARHIGEVRIFLAKSFRRRGLGTRMMETLITLGRKQNLYAFYAEVVADQSNVVKAFRNIGFKLVCTLEDFFMLPDGDLRDVAVLMLQLREKMDEF